jgi:SAM-dependent methyltransferase
LLQSELLDSAFSDAVTGPATRDSVCAPMPRTRRTARAAKLWSDALHGDAALARALESALAQTGDDARYTNLFHTYPAALHADAARALLALFPSRAVLDPFCGGGTVLVEARALGRRTYGCDVSPVAVRVARTRTATPDDETLSKLRARSRKLAADARAAASRGPLPDVRVLRAVESWYAPHVLRELESLRRGVAESEPAIRGFLEAILASILVKVSWRASDTKAAREKHHRPPGTAAVLFHKRARELARQMLELRGAVPPGTPDAEIWLGDARELVVRDPVDLVLTSPPYPSTYDYLPMQHLRHVWLGDRPDAAREIGARRLFRKGERTARETWRRDTELWSAAAARALAPGGALVLIVGDGWIPSGPVDAGAPSIAALERAGLALVAGASLERPELGGRRALREHVLAFRKPA